MERGKREEYLEMTKVIEIYDDKPTLEEMQKMVGGYIQEVYVGDQDVQYWVNEEGLLLELPLNPKASMMLGQPIVGNLVVLRESALLD